MSELADRFERSYRADPTAYRLRELYRTDREAFDRECRRLRRQRERERRARVAALPFLERWARRLDRFWSTLPEAHPFITVLVFVIGGLAMLAAVGGAFGFVVWLVDLML